MQLKTFYYNQHMKLYQKDDFVKVDHAARVGNKVILLNFHCSVMKQI